MAHQHRSEETRGRILQAAQECFARAGYEASGVAEICAAAGVSKGAFYHHFPTKQAVFIELLNLWLAGLDARFEAIRAGAPSVPEALRDMARAARHLFADARGQMPIFLEYWTQARRDPLLWEKTIEPYRRYEDYFAGLIRAGTAEGSLRPLHPETAARAIISLAIGLLVQGFGIEGGANWADTAEEGIEMLLEGMVQRGD